MPTCERHVASQIFFLGGAADLVVNNKSGATAYALRLIISITAARSVAYVALRGERYRPRDADSVSTISLATQRNAQP